MMTVSKLIEKLQYFEDKYGDVLVHIHEDGVNYPLDSAEIVKDSDDLWSDNDLEVAEKMEYPFITLL